MLPSIHFDKYSLFIHHSKEFINNFFCNTILGMFLIGTYSQLDHLSTM